LVIHSVRLGLQPLCDSDQTLAKGKTVTGLMLWCVFPDGWTGGRVCLLYPTPYWSLLHLTLSGFSFTRPLLESSSLTLSGFSFTRPPTAVF